MRYFLSAAELQSFAKAADACFTSRQNIARSVKNLERELGVELFIRKGNIIALTSPGERAADLARGVVESVDLLKSEFTHAERTQNLNIVFASPYLDVVTDTIIQAINDYPYEPITISEADCSTSYDKVLSCDVDAAVAFSMKRPFPNCSVIPLKKAMFYAVVSADSPLAQLDHIEVKDLAGHKLLLLGDPSFQYGELLDEYRREGLDSENIDIITGIRAMKRIVRGTDAVAITGGMFNFSKSGVFKELPFRNPEFRWHLSYLYRADTGNVEAKERFAKYLRARTAS